MSENKSDPGADILFQLSWEGPMQLSPGVARAVKYANGPIAPEETMDDIAAWVAVTAISGSVKSAAKEAIRAKVREALVAWGRVNDQAKIDELKQLVTARMMKHRPNGRVTEAELRQLIDDFFNSVHE